MSSSKLPAWGAICKDGKTRFRIWGPAASEMKLCLGQEKRTMEQGADGWHMLTCEAEPGTMYHFELPNGQCVPDPAARQQTADVHGQSIVVSGEYTWQNDTPNTPWEASVIYELHIGTFTLEGTFQSAIQKLSHLAELGINVIEVMPVAQFAGDYGWGYDGVLHYAPHPAYGSPDDMRAFIDAAHGHGIKVLLDVVYNHFGPEGNYLGLYAPEFFDARRATPWGDAIDYTNPAVRRFFIDNALYWLEDFKIDGLRLDAIDHIRDPSDPELLVELAAEINERIERTVHLTTEDNRNITWMHKRERGKPVLMTGEWNDDFHNAAHVLLTGEFEGYYEPFAKAPTQLFIKSLAEGYSTLGAGDAGVSSADMPPDMFIDFLQNHDQIGNRAFGERLTSLTSLHQLRAMQTILLLSPHIPLMFMGDEWDETAPFQFFANFDGDLGRAVTEGRRNEFESFSGFSATEVPDPIAVSTFQASHLNWDKLHSERGKAAAAFHQALLALRQEYVVPLLISGEFSGAVVHDAPEGCVAVDWAFGDKTLSMRANVNDFAISLPEATGHRIALFGTDVGGAGSAAVFLS